MADPPRRVHHSSGAWLGIAREIDDPQAEIERLARDRQVSAGQICAEEDRAAGCPYHGVPQRERAHDPAHCDRAWGAARG